MSDIPQNSSYDPAAFSAAMANTSSMVGKIAPRTTLLQKMPAVQGLAEKVQATTAGQANSMPGSAAHEAPADIAEPAPLKQLGNLTTPYGGSTKFEGFHPGVDIANKRGTPIPFVAPGKVIETSSGHKQGDKGYGNYVVVQDPKGNKVKYSHLDSFNVAPGQEVKQGETDLFMGNSGSTYSNSGGDGTHLDLRIQNMYGQYMNPFAYFQAIEDYSKKG